MTEEPVTYQLATIDSPDITGIRGLTLNEYNRYSKYVSDLNMLMQDENFFNLVTLNHTDLKFKINEYVNEYERNPNILLSERNPIYLNINRLILNFLSSVRTFLDHTETRFKRKYGENSIETNLFKKLTNKAYDENFSYRFLYKLRNYSQHCGLPAGSISTNSSGDTNGATVNTLTLSLMRDNLLESFNGWGAQITQELKNQLDYFDIVPLIDDFFEKLKEINKEITSKLYLKFYTEGHELMELLWQTEKVGGIACLLKTVGKGEKLKLTLIYFPFEAISKITGVQIDVQYTGE